MNCQSFHEQVLDLILPTSETNQQAELANHAECCPACAQYLAEMTQILQALQPTVDIKATSTFKERVMNQIAMMEPTEIRIPQPHRNWFWQLGLAAAILLAVALLSQLSNRPPNNGMAWALEKTIEAYRGMRFIHMKYEPALSGHTNEAWAQFNEQGQLSQMRLDFSETPDGPKVVVWQADKAEVWLKKKNIVAVLAEPNILQKMKKSVEDFDPHLLTEGLHKKQIASQLHIETLRHADSKNPLAQLKITYKEKPDEWEVYYVDSATRLVTQIEKFQRKDGKEQLTSRVHYLDYNNPDVAKAFKIEAPADATRIDQATREIGLAKGNLGDNEIAMKVARTFFEALIAGNYDQAGLIYEGIPGSMLKKTLAEKKIRFLRIVSVEKSHPHPVPATKGLQVPCKIEMEVNGTKFIETMNLGIRAVYNKPDRWGIFGGF